MATGMGEGEWVEGGGLAGPSCGHYMRGNACTSGKAKPCPGHVGNLANP